MISQAQSAGEPLPVPSAPHGYVPELDGLRALSAFAVLLCHTDLSPNAGLGVDVFFVISGYLITSILARARDAGRPLRYWTFQASRIVRLGPALFTVLATYLAFVLVVKHGAARSVALLNILAAATYTMNWVRAFNLFQDQAMSHTWSLGIELQFYLIWPFAVVLLGALKPQHPERWLLGLAAADMAWRLALAASGASVSRIYNGLDTHFDGLLLGAAIAVAPRPAAGGSVAARTWWIPALLLGVEMLLPPATTPAPYAVQMTGQSVLSAWLIIGVVRAQPAALRASWLVWLGTISYEIYLWHFPLIYEMRWHEHLPHIVEFAVLSVACVALAAVTHKFVGEPLRITFKRRIARLALKPA
ncbi:acyltransferase [Phenylobacterium sp.]|uniref:acyltransferase family protein n=1 Tax=Phenylobacterium sp. TaxID=1871053 RepID=UPI00121A3907|nr:acyltransferase [Phenylobacterium sp.]THD63286.1 MAG: acyltransferase [Phenylobacterium sp.]